MQYQLKLITCAALYLGLQTICHAELTSTLRVKDQNRSYQHCMQNVPAIIDSNNCAGDTNCHQQWLDSYFVYYAAANHCLRKHDGPTLTYQLIDWQ